MNLLRSFNATLARRPLVTQIAVSGAVAGAGDLFAQYISGQKTWDHWRTARFSFLAAFCIAPPLNVWFRVLEKVKHSNRHAQVFARMGMDQALFRWVGGGKKISEKKNEKEEKKYLKNQTKKFEKSLFF
ncbi:hypothetical protein NEIG_02666 [Nematocida sp. ERTm5]|nr:hypothetical protein NEIG_02666 [Nematocida sp. ERTm5]